MPFISQYLSNIPGKKVVLSQCLVEQSTHFLYLSNLTIRKTFSKDFFPFKSQDEARRGSYRKQSSIKQDRFKIGFKIVVRTGSKLGYCCYDCKIIK